MKMTHKQSYAIFCITGYDVRTCNISIEQASDIISKAKTATPVDITKIPGAILKRIVKKPAQDDFQVIYDRALEAGLATSTSKVCQPMVVAQHKNMLDDNSPIVHQEVIEGGVCGFAWVNIRPATQPFCKWLKKQGIVDRVAYEGGYNLWAHVGGQSMERKEAWAQAVVNVLDEAGIKSHACSRMY